MTGKKVNTKGYLLDARGNIIDKEGNIIWRSHELMYNEPPKIFAFTEFSMNWIRGNLNHDVTRNPKHDDEVDLDGRKINSMGYLIDYQGHIIDIFGANLIFKKQVLDQRFGQEAEIPYVYRSGKLRQPELDTIERQFERRQARIENRYLTGGGLEYDMDIDDEDVFKELNKFDLKLGKNEDGSLMPARDRFGKLIEDIPRSNDQLVLLDRFEADSEQQHQEDYHNSQEISLFNKTKK